MNISKLEFHKGLPDLENVQSLHDGAFHEIVFDYLFHYIVKSIDTQKYL